jgi:O-antigen/teichoic acid export membrane protein
MFSDIGIGPSIIQHKRGDEKSFLNTAWTLQVVRGALIAICAAAIAWPVSIVYSDSILRYALPVAALSALIGGFNSINLQLLNRHVKLARLSLINLGTQVVAIVGTVMFAYVTRSVWALIAGAILSAIIKLIASHLFCPGPRHDFAWDRTATRDLFHFGKWIFFSTLFGFLASKGDQVILGVYMTSKAEFGLYFTAASLSGALVNGVHTISGRVLFPVYARLATEAPDTLRKQTFRVRAILMALTVPPVCVLAIWGQEIVQLLYVNRHEYYGAGWMLQILAMGAVVSVIGSTVGPVLLAMGDSYRFMIIQITRTILMCITMATCGYIGWRLNGESGAHFGVLIGVALPEVFLYPILVWAVRRYGVWLPKLDIAGFVIAGVVIALGLLL